MFASRSFSLRLQLREENHVADVFLAEQHQAQAVDADAARRRHAVFEGDEEIWLLLLAAGPVLQRLALLDGIVLLCEPGTISCPLLQHSKTSTVVASSGESFQQRFEPGLLEMLVASQCQLKAHLLHHQE